MSGSDAGNEDGRQRSSGGPADAAEPIASPMHLLVAVDDSPASRHALAHALWLAQGRAKAMITLLNVQNYDTVGISEIDPDAEHARDVASRRSQKVLQSAGKVCAEAGVACQTRAEFGPVSHTILSVAQETHADQIVMGSRGRGRLGTTLVDRVVIGVIGAADIPVTVVTKRARLPARLALRRRSSGKRPAQPGRPG